MFERSEFGLRTPSAEKRREPLRRSRSRSRPAKTVLVTFAKTKVTRASARTLLPLILAPQRREPEERQGQRLSVAARTSSFLKDQKGTKSPSAGRDPSRLRRAGSLCSSPDAARRPNSLRSNMGASAAAAGCGARLALRLEDQMQMQRQRQRQWQRQRQRQRRTLERRPGARLKPSRSAASGGTGHRRSHRTSGSSGSTPRSSCGPRST